MKIALVEDEAVYIRQLSDMLYEWGSKNIPVTVHPYSSGEDFLEAYRMRQEEFDVIFLDIELGEISGLDVARKLRDNGYDNAIIFATNHPEFALNGYDVAAMHYLVKPICYRDIEKCLGKIDQAARFTYYFKGEHVALPFQDILYFESSGHYVHIHTLHSSKAPHPMRINLSDIPDYGLPKHFVQCHRSFIVNLSHVTKIKDKQIYLRGDKVLSIGKNYLDSVIMNFEKYSY